MTKDRSNHWLSASVASIFSQESVLSLILMAKDGKQVLVPAGWNVKSRLAGPLIVLINFEELNVRPKIKNITYTLKEIGFIGYFKKRVIWVLLSLFGKLRSWTCFQSGVITLVLIYWSLTWKLKEEFINSDLSWSERSAVIRSVLLLHAGLPWYCPY